MSRLDVPALVRLLRLEPLPVEGGMFRRIWAGPVDASGRPRASHILYLMSTSDGMFSAMHRLPVDELWHFQLGDPVEVLLLFRDGSWRLARLGPDLLGRDRIQVTVPAGTWMGARVVDGGEWALVGCTAVPGFVDGDYEGGDASALCAEYPEAADLIRRRCRRPA